VSSSSTETSIDVVMPQMGVSVSEGTIVQWRKQVGDWVAYEEPLVDISTDKILAEIIVEVGTTVDVGTVLARLATDARPGEPHASESDAPPPPPETSDAAAATGDSPAPSTPDPAPKPAVAGAPGADARRYSPVVSRMAAEHGIDLARVDGTGRGGRVRKQDVLAFLENGGGQPEPPMHIESPYRPDPPKPKPAVGGTVATGGAYQPPAAAPLSRMRRSIGEHMKRSLDTAATCTSWIEVDMSGVERERAKAGLTALAFVARATIDALREFPALNAWLEGEQQTIHRDVNLGIAVSLGEDGLIVPVIHGAQDLSAEGLGRRVRELARAARAKTLSPDDVQGGTFTITNPGQHGTLMATPVINQPQVAILDLEAVVKRPVVVTDVHGSDSIAIRPMCVFGLSWDHRALDGVLAARFLAAVRDRLQAL
jgi:pyruvate/2-oxoglutarate dehydrogenase complex dihydrolipoamide acyltransferase (E2) component